MSNLDKIKSVVLNQLTGLNGLNSLKVQNHIYGCFIIMEDIAQGNFNISEGFIISTPKYSFDLDAQFEQIGIRYGFAMDTKLALDTYSADYKSTWLEVFKDCDMERSIEAVDNIEDALLVILQQNVGVEDAFFLSAVETGSLPQEWIEKVFGLLNTTVADSSVNRVSKAVIDKPVAKRRFDKTRRAGVNKKSNNITLSKRRLL